MGNLFNETLVFGHKNPDTDTIMSAMVMANLENKLGNNAKAVRLGNVNKETEYVFKFLGIEQPEFIEDIADGQDIILVDHNEATQSADNLSNANVKKIVDHHAINFTTSNPVYYRAEPVGCTSTVLYKMYKENDVEISKEIATMMLSAIISDTLLFKSPTCTAEDKAIAEKLAKIAGVDAVKMQKRTIEEMYTKDALDVPYDKRIENVCDIIVFRLSVPIKIGSRKPALKHVVVQCGVSVGAIIIRHIFAQRKRIYPDLKGAPRKQRRKIGAEQKCVRPRDIDIKLFRRVQTVDSPFKVRAHLYLVDQNEVIPVFFITIVDIIIKPSVFSQMVVFRKIKIDMDDIRLRRASFKIFRKCFQQL